jgi:hypothetical protein
MPSTMRRSSQIRDPSSFLRLVYALARNEKHESLTRWLNTATFVDLKLLFPVLLNWSVLQMKRSSPPATQDIQVVQTILQRLQESTLERMEKDSVELCACLLQRMSLSGYLRANQPLLQSAPMLQDLVKDHDNPLLDLSDEPLAANTIAMVNNKETKLLPGEACDQYISKSIPVLHPFTGEKVNTMTVLKVFDTSKTKPAWIRYYGIEEGSDHENQPLSALMPDAIAKQGDDLRNDQAIGLISKLCNAMWILAPVDWKLGVPPTVFAYDVVVASADSGYLQHVPGMTFFELNQRIKRNEDTTDGKIEQDDDNKKRVEIGWDRVNLEKLAPSLAGSYVTNFILGTRDRHEHNMMVVGDMETNPSLMQIDFGYILMEYPGGVHFDTPRLTMPIPLIDRLNVADGIDGTTLMMDLQRDMLAAYLVLRRHATELIELCKIILSTSHDPTAVETFLRGAHALRTFESEKASSRYFSRKLDVQLSRFVFRREVRQQMVASYYTFHRGVDFSKKLASPSRQMLMTRATKALNMLVQTQGQAEATDKKSGIQKRSHRRSLSADDVPALIGSIKMARAQANETNDPRLRSEGGIPLSNQRNMSLSSDDDDDDDEDLDDQGSVQSEPEFI